MELKMSIDELREKYKDSSGWSKDELVEAMVEDGLIYTVIDEVTGERLFILTDFGTLVFPGSAPEKTPERVSQMVSNLWSHGLVEVGFSEDGFLYDSVSFTKKAFDEEFCKALPDEVRQALYSIRQSMYLAEEEKKLDGPKDN